MQILFFTLFKFSLKSVFVLFLITRFLFHIATIWTIGSAFFFFSLTVNLYAAVVATMVPLEKLFFFFYNLIKYIKVESILEEKKQ